MTAILLLLLAAVLIWAFAKSRTAGTAAAAVVGVIAAVGLGYYIWQDATGSRTAEPPETRDSAPAPEQFKRSLTALQPSDIVLLNLTLQNKVETYSGLDGVQRQRPDRGSWALTGAVKNLAKEQTIKDVGLQVRLYSCPTYYMTPIEEVKLEELASVCSRIGSSSVGLYDLAAGPGMTVPFSATVIFRNQGRADNWRFWVDVTRVVAEIEPSGP